MLFLGKKHKTKIKHKEKKVKTFFSFLTLFFKKQKQSSTHEIEYIGHEQTALKKNSFIRKKKGLRLPTFSYPKIPRIKISRIQLLFFLAVCVLASIFLGIYLYMDSVYRIKKFQLQQYSTELPSGLSKYYNQLIFFVRESDIAETVKVYNPTIKNVDVTKVYPDTIKVYLSYNAAIVAFHIDEGYLIIAADGNIMQKTKTPPLLPMISYYQKFPFSRFHPGEIIPYTDVKSTLIFLQKALDLGVKITSIDINSLGVIGLKGDDVEILFTNSRSVEMQIYEFETILKNIKSDSVEYSKLDFRFDKPVLTKK